MSLHLPNLTKRLPHIKNPFRSEIKKPETPMPDADLFDPLSIGSPKSVTAPSTPTIPDPLKPSNMQIERELKYRFEIATDEDGQKYLSLCDQGVKDPQTGDHPVYRVKPLSSNAKEQARLVAETLRKAQVFAPQAVPPSLVQSIHINGLSTSLKFGPLPTSDVPVDEVTHQAVFLPVHDKILANKIKDENVVIDRAALSDDSVAEQTRETLDLLAQYSELPGLDIFKAAIHQLEHDHDPSPMNWKRETGALLERMASEARIAAAPDERLQSLQQARHHEATSQAYVKTETEVTNFKKVVQDNDPPAAASVVLERYRAVSQSLASLENLARTAGVALSRSDLNFQIDSAENDLKKIHHPNLKANAEALLQEVLGFRAKVADNTPPSDIAEIRKFSTLAQQMLQSQPRCVEETRLALSRRLDAVRDSADPADIREWVTLKMAAASLQAREDFATNYESLNRGISEIETRANRKRKSNPHDLWTDLQQKLNAVAVPQSCAQHELTLRQQIDQALHSTSADDFGNEALAAAYQQFDYLTSAIETVRLQPLLETNNPENTVYARANVVLARLGNAESKLDALGTLDAQRKAVEVLGQEISRDCRQVMVAVAQQKDLSGLEKRCEILEKQVDTLSDASQNTTLKKVANLSQRISKIEKRLQNQPDAQHLRDALENLKQTLQRLHNRAKSAAPSQRDITLLLSLNHDVETISLRLRHYEKFNGHQAQPIAKSEKVRVPLQNSDLDGDLERCEQNLKNAKQMWKQIAAGSRPSVNLALSKLSVDLTTVQINSLQRRLRNPKKQGEITARLRQEAARLNQEINAQIMLMGEAKTARAALQKEAKAALSATPKSKYIGKWLQTRLAQVLSLVSQGPIQQKNAEQIAKEIHAITLKTPHRLAPFK